MGKLPFASLSSNWCIGILKLLYKNLLNVFWIFFFPYLMLFHHCGIKKKWQLISERTADIQVFSYDTNISLLAFPFRYAFPFILSWSFITESRLILNFCWLYDLELPWTKASFIGNINIHVDSLEHLLSKRFNNFLKSLDFVTISCIQANVSICLELCHSHWALSG